VTAQYLDRPLPYSHQYSAGFQYQLPGNWLIDASYVGNITKRLPISLNLNFVPTDVQNSIPVDQRSAYFNTQVTNPMAGLVPNSGLNNATLTRAQLSYAFPQYNQVTITDVPIGSQRYDSGQFKATKRFSHGFITTVAFTMGKALEQISTLNAQDVNLANLTSSTLEKRLTQYDVPRQLSITCPYDLPSVRGRPFLQNSNRWVNGIIGGWTVSGVFMSHSGYPIAFPMPRRPSRRAPGCPMPSATSSRAQRPVAVRSVVRRPGSTPHLPTTRLDPAPFTLRNFPTRFPDVRTKPLNVADVSIFRSS
jgi:hypothetical protein